MFLVPKKIKSFMYAYVFHPNSACRPFVTEETVFLTFTSCVFIPIGSSPSSAFFNKNVPTRDNQNRCAVIHKSRKKLQHQKFQKENPETSMKKNGIDTFRRKRPVFVRFCRDMSYVLNGAPLMMQTVVLTLKSKRSKRQ